MAGLKPGPPKSPKQTADSSRAIAFRTFRPELPANVESTEGSFCRISFRGARGEVVAASGPWRTSGDWWEEHGWRQDEWDMEIRFNRSAASPSDPSDGKRASRRGVPDGIYRIYYDWTRQGWFVRGRYD